MFFADLIQLDWHNLSNKKTVFLGRASLKLPVFMSSEIFSHSSTSCIRSKAFHNHIYNLNKINGQYKWCWKVFKVCRSRWWKIPNMPGRVGSGQEKMDPWTTLWNTWKMDVWLSCCLFIFTASLASHNTAEGMLQRLKCPGVADRCDNHYNKNVLVMMADGEGGGYRVGRWWWR